MTRQPRIAVVGSANVDLTTFVDRLPDPGETLFGRDFDLGFGGKGANQAVAASRCGAAVQLIARVGSDLFGPATIAHYRDLGIDVRHLRSVEGTSSGVAPIFVDRDGQNRILVVKGANDALRPEDVDRAAEDLGRADCILLQLEVPLETVYHTVAFAHDRGIRCILNPAPAQRLDLSAIRGVDYVVPNETEAAALAGIPVSGLADAERCGRALLERGLRRVVITLGDQGALLVDHNRALPIAPHAVKARDTSGAGDAFIGSLATFLAEGVEERRALDMASLYAALSTTEVGTQKSFLTRHAFLEQWKAHRGGDG